MTFYKSLLYNVSLLEESKEAHIFFSPCGVCNHDIGNLTASKPELCSGPARYEPFNNGFVYQPPRKDNTDTWLMGSVRHIKDTGLKSYGEISQG